jgi:hypothetical protein
MTHLFVIRWQHCQSVGKYGCFTPGSSDDDSEVANATPSGRKGARRELNAADDVSIRCVKPMSTQEWAEVAKLLFSRTPPLIDRPKCRCLCIACVGVGPSNAKQPSTTPAMPGVCGETILFSICQKQTSSNFSNSVTTN